MSSGTVISSIFGTVMAVGSLVHAGTGLYSFEQECATGFCPQTAGPASCVAIGTTRGGETCILTAAHCVEQRANLFYAVGETGTKHQCYLLHVDRENDIACLITQSRLSVAPGWTTQLPSVGETVKLRCSLTRRYQESDGKVLQVSPSKIYAALWSHPGSSGGPWYDARGYVVGVHTSKVVGEETRAACGGVAMGRAIQAFERRYGTFVKQQTTEQCRDCGPVIVRPQVRQPMMGIGVPVGPPSVQNVVVGRQPLEVQTRERVVIAPCEEDLRRLVAEYMARNPAPPGERGPAGQNGRDAEVNYGAIIEAVVAQLPPPQQGPPGPAGPAGPQGLIGVPDAEDIQNWLVGAMSNPETRERISVLLADLVAVDPRVSQLIQRIEALEAASTAAAAAPGDLQAIISRLQALEERRHAQRVLLVDGQTQTVLDDETYIDEPIVLDVRKFIRGSK